MTEAISDPQITQQIEACVKRSIPAEQRFYRQRLVVGGSTDGRVHSRSIQDGEIGLAAFRIGGPNNHFIVFDGEVAKISGKDTTIEERAGYLDLNSDTFTVLTDLGKAPRPVRKILDKMRREESSSPEERLIGVFDAKIHNMFDTAPLALIP